MRDLFDEFLEELRREAERRRRAAADRGTSPEPVDDEADRADRSAAGAEADVRGSAASGSEEEPPEEPIIIRVGRRGGRPGGGGRPPSRRGPGGPDDGAPTGGELVRAFLRRLGIFGLLAVGFVLISLFTYGLDLWTDAIWFDSVGYGPVFWTRLSAQGLLFMAVLLAATAVILGNLWLAGRLAPPPGEGPSTIGTFFERLTEAARAERGDPFARGWYRERPLGPRPLDEGIEPPNLVPLAVAVLAGVGLLVALGLAGAAGGRWELVLLWLNRVPFSPAGEGAVVDPIFGRDIAFFLFDLPFFRLVQSTANGIVLASIVVALGRYLADGLRGRLAFTTPMRVHLGALGALYLLSVAIGYQLDKYELVYSTQGVATGVSYTDETARFFALDTLTIVAALAAAFLVGGAFTRMLWPLGGALVVWFGASVVLGTIYPEVVQRLVVVPNELAREERYIANNIAMTRLAYGLEAWEQRRYQGEGTLDEAKVVAEDATFRNARLWDYRPLRVTLDQLQTIRRYYEFVDVDTDRYVIDGRLRQVMLSARELAKERNPQATSWVNVKITYTHGVGVAMVPVNEVTPEGQPRLFIRDMPPVSASGAPELREFRIYFGERPSDYVIVGAVQSEFDYPAGAEDGSADLGTRTRWRGTTGIRLDTLFARLLFALRFRDLNLLISDQITAESQLLFHRSLGDRLPQIAPFLRYDKDPYVVIHEGRLVWIQDAFTVSSRFPHGEPFDPTLLGPATGLGPGSFNYIRNSVKIVVDAYDGTTTFYVADPDDPLIRAYARIFPSLFRPIEEMPADLRAHVRYPEELFNVQTRVFALYHVTAPAAFYNREDLWTVPADAPTETLGPGQQSLPMEAYYVVMRMPGEPEPEFLLLQPMVPVNRPNMIAWVAARNDGETYGQVRYYQFPEETTVFGPAQIAARIDQDPLISAQITLWSQAGSEVIRGNLIVVPVQDAIIYLQPIYLQSTGSAFPEFRKIVVASPTRVVWGDTLAEALRLLIAPGPGPSPSPGPGPSPGPSPTPGPSPSVGPEPSLPSDVAALVEYANRHFQLAQEALRNGDFARYGEEIRLVEEALRRLDALVRLSPAP